MTEFKNGPVPNPGSNDALDQGCACPVLDNNHGRGVHGKTGEFWISTECPLHGGTPPPVKEEKS